MVIKAAKSKLEPTRLAAMRQKLADESLKRRAAEKSLKQCNQHYRDLLLKSGRTQVQLRFLSRRILQAQEEERKQISRELHDEITQILTGIKIRLASLTLEASSNTRGIKKKIAGTQRMVEESVNIVHRFARELRPTMLDDLGLIPALHAYAKTVSQRTGLRIRISAFLGVEKLSVTKKTVMFRVAQSALNNVAQHAKASLTQISILKLPKHIQLEIKDNGIAFNAERALLATQPKRLGILSMRERVEMVGGTFAIDSRSGKGTSVRAMIPILGEGVK
jgi:two-component system, NarL family, sensor histidine kinase DegS